MRRRVMENGGAEIAPPPPQPLQARIAALAELPIAELRQAWSAAWGAPPPKGARRRLLMLGIAWTVAGRGRGRLLQAARAAARDARGGLPARRRTEAERAWTFPTAAPARRPADPDLEDRAARGAGRRERLSLGRPELGLALVHRPRDHRHPPQRPGLLRPARPGSAVTPSPARPMRCAIYTRVSSDEGLEQAFNSLDAQREACAAYILSQKHEGWSTLPARYDDGGFSGGSMDRPALQAAARRCARPAGSMR